jgi:hypothetical protein
VQVSEIVFGVTMRLDACGAVKFSVTGIEILTGDAVARIMVALRWLPAAPVVGHPATVNV